jgi:pilus assembly protein CpaC
MSFPLKWCVGGSCRGVVTALGFAAAIIASNLAAGQEFGQTENGLTPNVPASLQNRPRPAAEISSFLDSLSTNDAAFKVKLGQGRLLTFKEDIAMPNKPAPLVAIGDESILDFNVIGPRQMRLIGKKVGTTDVSIITPEDKNYNFEVQVEADLSVLRATLKAKFPDASLKMQSLGDHVVVEGQARDTVQVAAILRSIDAYLNAVGGEGKAPVRQATSTEGDETSPIEARIINLIRVPGPQQVMLKVKLVELNRTALRQFGANFQFADQTTAIGTNIAGTGIDIMRTIGAVTINFTGNTTIAGSVARSNGAFDYAFNALRRNGVTRVLAEPNLVTMHGHEASFLAGGEFPIPVAQSGAGASNGSTAITVVFKEFGVKLAFIPYILDDETIRLSVDPEVSSLNFALGTESGGTRVPGLDSRKAHTTVELSQGQTLAIAGLLQQNLDGTTDRIPGVGDIPIIGQLFSNVRSERVERELIVLVTPYLVESMKADQVPPTPGDEVKEPNDLEFYLLGRIEGRTGVDFRSTTKWDDALHFVELMHLEKRHIAGPCGFSD